MTPKTHNPFIIYRVRTNIVSLEPPNLFCVQICLPGYYYTPEYSSTIFVIISLPKGSRKLGIGQDESHVQADTTGCFLSFVPVVLTGCLDSACRELSVILVQLG
jgi:hypothetical protein